MLSAGRFNGRGRGARRNNRGGRGIRAEITAEPRVAIAPADDSGEEDIEDQVLLDRLEHIDDDYMVPFLIDPRLDGASDEEVEVPAAAAAEVAAAPAEEGEGEIPIWELLDNECLGDQDSQQHFAHSGDDKFDPGPLNTDRRFEKYERLSPVDLVLTFVLPFFEALLQCSNAQLPRQDHLTMRDMFLYHAFLTFRCLVPLSTNEAYWNPDQVFVEWKDDAKTFFALFTLRKFYQIRRCLKGYLPADDMPDKPRDWKVRRPWEAVQRALCTTISCCLQYLSLDEAMARASSTMNPVYTSLGNAKPLEGFRFIALVEYESKVIVGIIFDNKSINAENCAGFPGGYVGALMTAVFDSASCLIGQWYIIMADNYYNSAEYSAHIRNTRSLLVGGTLKAANVPKEVRLTGPRGQIIKRPKPSIKNPKGTLKMAYNHELAVYVYSWMDSALVYFVDPCYGPSFDSDISRKNGRDRVTFRVPFFILVYNGNMHAVDVMDQMRKYFGMDLSNATKKYTVRFFEVAFSLGITQGYNTYRYVHKANPNRSMGHTEFKASVFRGLVNHPVVRGPLSAVNGGFQGHHLLQYEPGSAGDGTHRRRRGCCRQCPNTQEGARFSRQTAYYCEQCNVCLHPECHVPYHVELNENSSAPKRRMTPNKN